VFLCSRYPFTSSETIPPEILVDGDSHENGSCDGLVGVYNIGGADSWYGCNLNASACVSN
jgi:hypothetical protein